MKVFRVLPLATLLAAAGAHAGTFSYDYLEASYGEYDVAPVDANALYLGGSKTMNKDWGVLGSVGLFDFDGGTDGTVLQGGAFFHTPLNREADFVGTARLFNVDVDGIDSELGILLSGGVRYAVQDNFQLEGELDFIKNDTIDLIGDDGLGIKVAARYFFDKQLSGAVGLGSDAEYDGLFLNLRYDLK